MQCFDNNNLFPDIEPWQYIANGGFGQVYKTTWKGKSVAVKRFLTFDRKKDSIQKDIEKEIQNLSRISGKHPGLINYYGSVMVEADLCIIMEYVEGESLWDRIEKTNGIDQKTAIDIIKQTLEVLKCIHPKYVHRDLKPANIMVTPMGKVKLVDFGLTKILKDTTNGTTTKHFTDNPKGTYRYMPPELHNPRGFGNKYGTSVDIWSLGMTCIAMVTGKHPYEGLTDYAVIFKIGNKKKPEYSLPDGYSKRFSDFIDLCLNVEPDKRPSAAELLEHPLLELHN